ncbi:MAG: hypothetical protein AAGK04_13380, partial [Planctomycetota bacterium]
MAESDPIQSDADQPDVEAADSTPDERTWRQLWHAPTLLAAAGLLVTGVGYAVATRPAPDFNALLREAERHTKAERYEEAIEA